MDDNSFQSYARNFNSGPVSFATYGKSFNHGNDTIKEYTKGSLGRGTMIGLKSYSMNRTFKDCFGSYFSFSRYTKINNVPQSSTRDSGSSVNRWVESGNFFRESMLKERNVMVMPDIKDRIPKRSFLPRAILSKLPFSTMHLYELKGIFHALDSSMERMLVT